MAINFHSTAFAPCTITPALSLHDRKAIERQIEALIELLDNIDGDPDIEDDEMHDDPLDLGEATALLPALPLYAIDQSKGPLNELAAHRAYRCTHLEAAA